MLRYSSLKNVNNGRECTLFRRTSVRRLVSVTCGVRVRLRLWGAGGRGCRRKRGRRIRGSTSSRTPRTGNYEIELFLRGESRGRVSRLGVFNRTRFRVFRYVRGVCDELSAAVASVKKGETELRGER